jgi:hypothetical protein
MRISPKNLSKCIKTSIAITALYAQLIATTALAKDAFGLDSYKKPAEALTGPSAPYRTKFGNSINVYSIKNEDSKADGSTVRFLVQGGLHGNELLGSEFVGWLATKFAKGDSVLNTLNSGNVEIDFIPFANPDGTIQFTRYNGNKINLNRNFGVLWGTTKENPGPTAFSESETRAIRDLFNKRKYSGSLDVHGYVNWVVIPTSPEDKVEGFPSATREQLANYEKWQKIVRRETTRVMPGYEVKTAGSLGDGGAFEDYAWWGAGVPSACLEVFSEDRFVAQSIAATIFDWITPRIFVRRSQMNGMSDTFLVYESYVHSLFKEAIKLRDDLSAKKDFIARIPQK